MEAGALFWGAVVGEVGVEIAEAFVMLRSHHHVFLPCLFGELGPGARGIGLRLETFGEWLVIAYRNALVFPHPFVAGEPAVHAPADKHTETRLVPPLPAATLATLFLVRTFF